MSASEILAIAGLSLQVASVATLAMLPPALALAHLLARRRFPGRALVEALVALPMVLPPVAVGLGLLLLLGREGPLGALLASLGIEIDNGQGAKITLQGPQVSVNDGALDVI